MAEGSYKEESALHRRFAHLNLVNEWFEPGDDLMGFIVADGKPWDGAEDGRVSVIHLQGPPEERDWLTAANRKTHLPKATIVRLALTKWCEANGLVPYPHPGDER